MWPSRLRSAKIRAAEGRAAPPALASSSGVSVAIAGSCGGGWRARPRDVAWSAYISARRHIDAGRVGEERLAYLIWQIAEVTLRNRRLEGAVVTDQRPVRCLLAQTPIVCSSSSTLTTPEHLAELRRMPFESSGLPKERTRLVGRLPACPNAMQRLSRPPLVPVRDPVRRCPRRLQLGGQSGVSRPI